MQTQAFQLHALLYLAQLVAWHEDFDVSSAISHSANSCRAHLPHCHVDTTHMHLRITLTVAPHSISNASSYCGSGLLLGCVTPLVTSFSFEGENIYAEPVQSPARRISGGSYACR